MCVPDEYSGKGVCISGHCWDNKKEKVFYLIGRKIGFLFVLFCFKHDKRLRLSLSFQTSWPRVDEDDQMVIREAGEQRHPPLALHWGQGGWTRGLCMAMPVWQLTVSCAHPSSHGHPFQLWSHLS